MVVGAQDVGDVMTSPDLGGNHEQQNSGTQEQGSRCPTGVDLCAGGDSPPG
jgi:hypothetical protein